MSEENNREVNVADKVLIVLFSMVLVVTAGWQFYQLAEGDWGSDLEERIEGESLAAMHTKELVQSAKTSVGWRTDGVIVEGGVSYLVEDLQHGSSRGEYVNGENSAYEAIVDFRDQLAAKNINLVVMIVDGKGVANHMATEKLVAALGYEGVDVLHVCGEPVDQYLKHDSHWRPEMMERQAQKLAAMIEEKATGFMMGNGVYTERVLEVMNEGDLVRNGYLDQTKEEVSVRLVEKVKGSSDAARVLLLGDSYSNIFSAAEMGWGETAGLGERLSFQLQSECKVIAVNGNGAHASREKLIRNPELLDGKQVVVWQFAARELDRESWEKIVIPEMKGEVTHSNVAQLVYEKYEVLALPVWKKDSVYSTSLTEVLLKRKRDGQEVLVRMLLKENKQFTKVGALKKGELIELKVSDSKAQKKYRRSELFSLDRYDLEVYWGELK